MILPPGKAALAFPITVLAANPDPRFCSGSKPPMDCPTLPTVPRIVDCAWERSEADASSPRTPTAGLRYAPGGAGMNEAQRKVLALRAAFSVAILCLVLLLAGVEDKLSQSLLSIVLVLALGFYLRASRKKKE